ncbi:hypothetical protein VTJ49DRAFT_727 [Mycothermus thermophilus]|uniref:Uncharacterized protein n=1 Tax=Humicola insolens TaxID=85995 RepID=A0ABR3VFB8_HUMIN
MDFQMHLDNPRKRCRDEVDLEFATNGDQGAKRMRQWDSNALLVDAPQLNSNSTTPNLSAASTPATFADTADAGMEMDMEPVRLPEPRALRPFPAVQPQQAQPQHQPQQFSHPMAQQQQQPPTSQQQAPRPQSNIIAGWNQARRNHYLAQGYPSYWMQQGMVAVVKPTIPKNESNISSLSASGLGWFFSKFDKAIMGIR